MRRFSRSVKTVVEPDGARVVLVSVNKQTDKIAYLYKEDFDYLLSIGVSPNWCTFRDRNNVLCSGKKRGKLGVARILLDAQPGQTVRYKDGNCLNLLKENLELVDDPRGKRRDRDYLPLGGVHG